MDFPMYLELVDECGKPVKGRVTSLTHLGGDDFAVVAQIRKGVHYEGTVRMSNSAGIIAQMQQDKPKFWHGMRSH